MSLANLFDKAKTVAPVVKTPKAATNAVEIKGLEDYAFFVEVEKTMKAEKDTPRALVDEAALDIFIRQGLQRGEQPESFDAKEGSATANISLKRRSSASPLNEEDLELLARHKITVEDFEVSPAQFIFNPEVLKDQRRMEEISKALSKVKGCEDIIQHIPAVTKKIVTDQTFRDVFAIKSKAVLLQVVPVVGTIAVRPKVQGKTTANIFTRVGELLGILKANKAKKVK